MGVRAEGVLVGAMSIGRPSARAYDSEKVAEITRTCTDGTFNANSKLYGAARAVCKAMGYHKVITYTQAGESGASLKAAGFVKTADLKPRPNWANSSTKLKHLRDVKEPNGVARCRWEIYFSDNAGEKTGA